MTSRTHISEYYKNYICFIRMGRTKDILPKLNGDLFLVDKSDISSSQS